MWPRTRLSWPSPRGLLSDSGFWEEGVSLWRVLRQGCAEKQEAGWLPTCLCATWTWECRVLVTTGAWWWTVCTSSAVGNWQSIPRWVSTLKGNGEPRRGAADRDGVALSEARRVKERTYPELVGPGARAQLGVLALEVGRRWSEEAKIFIRLLARARARSEPRLMRRRLEQAWRLWWYAIISCGRLRHLCWVCGVGVGRTGKCHHPMRSSATTP